jgi:predicted methyltransferase
MKTDYFTTYLKTVTSRPTSPPKAAVGGPSVAPSSSPDINRILKTLLGGTGLSFADLVKMVDTSPGELIPVLHQLQSFGLVEYDTLGVQLTPQGIEVASSL